MKLIAKYDLWLIFGLALLVRLPALNQSLWLDEAITAIVLRNLNYGAIVTQFSPTDFHPPLFYLVLKAWSQLFGTSEIALRSFSVVLSLIGVGLAYQIAKERINQTVGLIAALFLATGPLYVYYAMEARMYALETTLVLLSVWLFLRLIDKPTLRLWSLFTLANIAIVYTDYLPTFVFLVYFIWLLIRKRQLVIPFIGSMIAVALAFAPFLPIFVKQLAFGGQATNSLWATVLGMLSIKAIALVWVKFAIGRIAFENNLAYGLFVLIPTIAYGLLIAFSIFKKQDKQVTAVRNFCLLWLGVPLLLGGLLALKLAVFDYFRFLFVVPAFYLVLTLGTIALPRHLRLATVVGIVIFNLICLAIYFGTPSLHREDWRTATIAIEKNAQQPAILIFANAAQADGYRYYSSGIVPVSGPIDVSQHQYKTIWLSRYVQEIFDPEDNVRKAIEAAGYKKIDELHSNALNIWQYSY